ENSYSARRLRLSVLRTLRRARAPALPVLACLFLPHHFLGKAGRASAPNLLRQRLQVTHDFRRLPFIAAVQFEKLSVRANHHRAQRMEYLILSGFGVVKIAQAKELRDAFHFVGTTGGELPMLKSLVRVTAGVRRAIAA